MGDVPEAAGDGGGGEDETQFVDVALELAEIVAVVALAALVVDDEDGAVGAADDAVGAAVLDVVIRGGIADVGDGAFAIDLVGRVEPSSHTGSRVEDGATDVLVDIVDAATIVGVVGDDATVERLGDDTVHIVMVADAAQDAVQPDAGFGTGAGGLINPDGQLGGDVGHSIARDTALEGIDLLGGAFGVNLASRRDDAVLIP